jgi:hypothetical protein
VGSVGDDVVGLDFAVQELPRVHGADRGADLAQDPDEHEQNEKYRVDPAHGLDEAFVRALGDDARFRPTEPKPDADDRLPFVAGERLEQCAPDIRRPRRFAGQCPANDGAQRPQIHG